MIRKFAMSDIDDVMDIWLKTNISTHDFIDSGYWESNYDSVKEAIQDAEIYVYDADGMIRGFIGVIDDYIAGLFVEQQFQSMGIGSKLLSHAKGLKTSLKLGVYAENKKAVDFYEKHGFTVSMENMDEETGHVEYEMVWKGNV